LRIYENRARINGFDGSNYSN
jgi:hypothetical protein